MHTSIMEALLSLVSVCLSCLSVNRITQKPLIKSLKIFTEGLDMIQGPID